jgi:methylglutaconyl-CoA hydratase
MPDSVILSQINSIALITLNRPDRRNALDAEMVAELHAAIRAIESDDATRVVVLAAEGPAFCAGADLEYLRNLNSASTLENYADSVALRDMFYALRMCSRPTIAKVHGPALAGGCGLALACDIVVASDDARFGFPEVRIGFIPAIVMKLLVERVGMGNAREILFRGSVVGPDVAQQLGMINYVVGPDELNTMAERLAYEIAEKISPEAVRLTKQLLAEIEPMSLRESVVHAAAFNTIGRNTEAFRKGVNSFLNKEKLVW